MALVAVVVLDVIIVPFVASLLMEVCVGVPAVAQREPGPASKALTAIAQAVAARMSVRAAQASSQPVLTVS